MSVCTIPSVVSESRPRYGRIQRGVLAYALMILLTSATACASSGAKAGHGFTGKKMQTTPSQLQVQVRALADPFSGIIEEAVWELWETDQDPAWRRTLLIWQINVVNAVQRATFQPVPLAALFDTWALIEQLRDYAESGARLDRTQQQAQIVLDAVDRMEASILKIAVEAGGEEGAANAGRLVREWADKNPIDKFATRASTDAELAQWTARGNMGAMATVKSLGASLDDVMSRLDLYAEYIPKQASWHAQAVAYEWLGPQDTEGLFTDMSKTASAFDRIAFSLEHYPNVVADERRVVLETLQDERAIILEQVLKRFAEMQLFINSERIDLVENQLRIEREAIFEAIAAERAIIIKEAKQERADTMDELDGIIDGIVERSAIKVVDHFFIRAVQLLAILLVGIALIAVVVVLVWKRR